jgi:Spy/CpxP family protein refolding chaperone
MIKDCLRGGAVAAALIGFAAGSQAADSNARSPYAGQQARALKSLSQDDVAALKAGKGWGFAKPAELNGYPGPLHILELEAKLALTPEQKRKIEDIFAQMKAAAQKAGMVYLDAEQALEAAFASGTASPAEIARLTGEAGQARAQLRNVHLQAHLTTTPLLSPMQRHRYQMLRGYAGGAAHKRHGKGSHSGH